MIPYRTFYERSTTLKGIVMDDERREQLLKMDEIETAKLSRDEWYDRTRLLRQKRGDEMLARIKLNNHSYSGEKKGSSTQFWGPGHPAYDSLHAEDAPKKRNTKQW
jgi:hypothetical protein